MARGRRPEPRALQVLKGETRPSRIGTGEVQPPEQKPTLPHWAVGKEQWQVEFRTVWTHTLAQAPWLFAADQAMLEQYVVAYVDAARLGRALVRSPLLERDPSTGGPKPLTVRKEWQSALKTCLSLAQEFGLTPSARRGLRGTVEAAAGGQCVADDLFG